MRSLLIKLFIKDYNNVQSSAVRTAYGKLSGIVGIITNTFLCIIKIATGLLTGSISILADGINNLSDTGTSIITVIGFKMSNAPPDQKHPYGHQRLEYLTGMIISLIIFLIGAALMKTSIEAILSPSVLVFSWYAIIILIASILIKMWQSAFYLKNGKTINSNALVATSFDSLFDCISTTIVLVAFIVGKYTSIYLDGYMGVIVSMFILFSAFKLIKDTASPLIGEAPSQEYIDQIIEKLSAYEGVLGIHDLNIHSYGPAKTYITVHVEVDSKEDVVKSHNIIDQIEQDFMKREGVNMVIHMDPVDQFCEVTNEIRNQILDIVKSIDDKLNYHDLRIVEKPTQTRIIFDLEVPPGFELSNEELIAQIQTKTKEIQPTYQLFITIDRNYLL